LTRREIELPISSSNQAVNLLEALGYQIVLVYEKFREVFQLEDVEIMLDEVPFGCFVEVEGPDIASLKHAALRLGLAWEAGIDLSYAEIFESLKEAAGLGIQHMTFFDFEGYELDAIPTLGLRDALAEAGTRIE
jgi:adenylate cyclase class 2